MYPEAIRLSPTDSFMYLMPHCLLIPQLMFSSFNIQLRGHFCEFFLSPVLTKLVVYSTVVSLHIHLSLYQPWKVFSKYICVDLIYIIGIMSETELSCLSNIRNFKEYNLKYIIFFYSLMCLLLCVLGLSPQLWDYDSSWKTVVVSI